MLIIPESLISRVFGNRHGESVDVLLSTFLPRQIQEKHFQSER